MKKDILTWSDKYIYMLDMNLPSMLGRILI